MNKEEIKRIIDSRTLIFSRGVSSGMMEEITKLITFMEKESSTDPITAIINSPGGEAYSGLGLYDALTFMEPPLVTIVNGLCASAGILILLAADAEDRYSLPHSRFMIHQPSGGARGTSSDIQIEANEIKTLRTLYFQIIADKCGKELEEVLKDADRDFWLSAGEALEYKLVSKVISKRSEIS